MIYCKFKGKDECCGNPFRQLAVAGLALWAWSELLCSNDKLQEKMCSLCCSVSPSGNLTLVYADYTQRAGPQKLIGWMESHNRLVLIVNLKWPRFTSETNLRTFWRGITETEVSLWGCLWGIGRVHWCGMGHSWCWLPSLSVAPL